MYFRELQTQYSSEQFSQRASSPAERLSKKHTLTRRLASCVLTTESRKFLLSVDLKWKTCSHISDHIESQCLKFVAVWL